MTTMKKKQDANIGIFAGCCGLIYFHCTLRRFLKLSSCVTGYTRSYQKFHSGPAMTRGRYISEGYLYFLSHYSRSYLKSFSDDRAQITSLKNVQGSINTETVSSKIFTFFHQGKTQSVSENAISPPCAVKFTPFILSSSP